MSHGGDDFPEEHEEHVNHEAWVIPYADLLTLLMAMFIALFAMSTVDQSKFRELAIGFNEALGGGKLDVGIGGAGKATSPVVGQGQGNGPLNGATLMPNETQASAEQLAQLLQGAASDKLAGSQEKQSLQQVKKAINDAAKTLGLGGKVQTKELNGGLQVTLLTDKVLFQSGKADIEAGGVPLLTLIARVLTALDNPIRINGHTDSVPLQGGGKYDDNLDLSGARADAVYKFFAGKGIDRKRMTPAGQEDKYPIASNATDAGRAQNRRVEIIVESKVKQQVLDRAQLNDEPAPESTPTTKVSVTPHVGDDVDTGVDPGVNPGLPHNGG